MKISRHRYDLYKRLLLPAVVGVLAVSCIDDSSLCLEDQPGYDAADNVWISLEVKNQGVTGIDRSATRASSTDDSYDHLSEEATAAENYINPSDLTLVLFDANDRAMKTLSSAELTLVSLGTDDDDTYTSYKVVAKVNRAYFTFAAGRMSILAVANCHGINAELAASDYTAVPWQASLSELTNQLRTFQYNGYTSTSQTEAWLPYIPESESVLKGRYIPMAGYETNIDLNAENLAKLDAATTPDTALELPAIVMQRSMAKIRVLDGMQFQDGLRYFTKIENVTFHNGTKYGAIVPDVNQSGLNGWSNGTTIVESATKPTSSDSWFSSDLTFPFTLSDTFPAEDNDCPQWICYTPEMQVKDLTDDEDNKPYLQITTQTYSKTSHSTAVGNPVTYTVYLENYIDQSDIVRNHIYQFYVTMNEFSAELEINVEDWVKNEVEWEYTDNPGLSNDGYIKWNGFARQELNISTGYFDNDHTQEARGTFTIASPLGGTWRASLITLSGEPNAFTFIETVVDEDGNETDVEVESVSGDIDGKSATIRVRPKNAPGSEINSARVQFTVTTPDPNAPRTMIINMLDGNNYGSTRSYYTIVQEASL